MNLDPKKNLYRFHARNVKIERSSIVYAALITVQAGMMFDNYEVIIKGKKDYILGQYWTIHDITPLEKALFGVEI